MFALDEEIPRLETELAGLAPAAQAPALVGLAWHVRQRDTTRALALVAQARVLLAAAPDPRLDARCLLIEGEGKWLFSDLDGADALAMDARARFAAAGDDIGSADAHWLAAAVSIDRGHPDRTERELQAGADKARAAGDQARVDVFEGAFALLSVFRDIHSATERWSQHFDTARSDLHPGAAGWIHAYLGSTAYQCGDYGRAISQLRRTFDTHIATGQLRRAIHVATNIGNAFTCLHAHDVALEWMQRARDLARPTGWPMSIALGLMQTAETLRQLGQRDAACSHLQEAVQALRPLSGSRAYMVALEYQGDLARDCGDFEDALASFRELDVRAAQLQQVDFRCSAQRGSAHALSQLGRPEEALATALNAFDFAQDEADAQHQVAALQLLADIHLQHRLPGPETLRGATPVLHYLLQAIDLADDIEGYTLPASLFDAAAREFASVGDYKHAFETAQRAGAARDAFNSQEAKARAQALQVQYQTERAHADSEHLRQLAAAEAQRAHVQQQTSAMLEHMSAIGQEITTHLDAAAVFRALDRHVHGLLDATHFSVHLLEQDGANLRCAFGIEAGKTLAASRQTLDGDSDLGRCVNERREILIANPAASLDAPRSLLFAPLLIGERTLGVMSVQSPQADAYGERERLIFRTLCAYGAIALDNAAAYRQVAATLKTLSATQAQLMDKNLELENAYCALEEVSLTDQLTGLRNRRFFLQHVESDVAMSLRRYDDPLRAGHAGRDAAPGKDLVFFMVDIDHFKSVNDSYGHAAGDAVLVQMQERLREVFRESDYLVRWGGEEFLVLARATHRDEAKVVAERIRKAVANREFVLADGVRLQKTCSVGFACFPFLPEHPRLLSWSQVVELADQGLYLAKHSGRDAWAAIYSTEQSQPEGLFARLMQALNQTVASGQARIVTNLAQVRLDLAGG